MRLLARFKPRMLASISLLPYLGNAKPPIKERSIHLAACADTFSFEPHFAGKETESEGGTGLPRCVMAAAETGHESGRPDLESGWAILDTSPRATNTLCTKCGPSCLAPPTLPSRSAPAFKNKGAL